MLKLNIQLFGGRGSSSNIAGGYSSFSNLVKKREQTKYNLTFGTGIDLSERINQKTTSISSYKMKDLDRITNGINEAVVQVQQGSFEKRLSQLKDLGFKVISKTKPSNNKTDIMLAYIKKK